MNSPNLPPSTKHESIIGYLRLSLLLAFVFSLPPLFPAFQDVFHVVISARVRAANVESSLLFGFVYGVSFIVIPFFGIRAFRDEQKRNSKTNLRLEFLVIGVISVFWGVLHVWNASSIYSDGMTIAGRMDVNAGSALLTIYGSYAILVGLPWILSGVLFLGIAYRAFIRRHALVGARAAGECDIMVKNDDYDA